MVLWPFHAHIHFFFSLSTNRSNNNSSVCVDLMLIYDSTFVALILAFKSASSASVHMKTKRVKKLHGKDEEKNLSQMKSRVCKKATNHENIQIRYWFISISKFEAEQTVLGVSVCVPRCVCFVNFTFIRKMLQRESTVCKRFIFSETTTPNATTCFFYIQLSQNSLS